VIKLSKAGFLVATLTLCHGCASTTASYQYAYEPRVEWPEQEYAAVSVRRGKNLVSGQAFLKTRGGDVKTAAGNLVLLNPATSYSTQFVDVIIKKLHGIGTVLTPETPDIRLDKFLKQTTADGDGRFEFHDVADGEYYLYTTVVWEAVGQRQGGWVYKKITVSSQARNNYILNTVY
jgi:hypothetical protein